MPEEAGSFLGIPAAAFGLLLFALGILFAVFTFRLVAEGVVPKLKDNRVWRDRILPLFPIFLGAIVALFVTNFPFPAGFSAPWPRFFLGVVGGGASGWIYKVGKAKVKAATGVDIGFTDPPPGTEVKVSVRVPPLDKTPEDTSRKEST